MQKNAPAQKARTPKAPIEVSAPVTVVIAIDNLDLEPWRAFAISENREDLASVITVSTATQLLREAITYGDILVLLHIGGVTEFGGTLLQSLAGLREVHRPAVLLVAAAGNTSPSGAVQTAGAPGMKVRLADVSKALELMSTELARAEMTPLRSFAPQLLDAFLDPARRESKAQENAGPNGQSNTDTNDDEESSSTYPFDPFQQKDFSELAWQMLEVARRLGRGATTT